MKELEKTFEKVRYVGWETSMSPIIEREKKVMHYSVGWNQETNHGWFEMYDKESGGEDYHAEGSLSFTGKVLNDYDGVFELDEEIISCLKGWGADTSYVE
tara:strand:+ start:89 stop:388 length:300 start_codon:yes stop_codon:yes gene_type:complete